MAAVSAAPVAFYTLCLLQTIRFTLWQIMFIALYERVQNKTPQLARASLIAASAGAAGLITVAVLYFNTIRIVLQHRIQMQDVAAYRAFDAIAGGLIFTTAHFYGWAFLLMGCAIIRTRAFSSILGWLLVAAGLFGLLGFIYLPLTAVFLLMICVVSIWTGTAMLRQKQPQSVLEEMAVSK
jgi:heme exporter protein D